MEATVVASPRAGEARREAHAGAVRIPWYIHAVLFASASVILGVLWDISWHQTIGRDTLFSAPHLAIYLGGVVAGVSCGVHVLRLSFAGSAQERGAAVTWWRFFRGPLGAWLCIWGAIAMLTSAPFDDWWHNAYGLDVKILSPPHAVLALGILAIQMGAMFMVLALQNRSEELAAAGALDDADRRSARTLRWMYAVAAALVLMNFAVMFSEYTWRIYQHQTLFYQVVCAVLPLPLIAAAVAGRLRWPATAAAAAYTAVLLALIVVFPLFGAEPKLAPVRNPIGQMMPPQFPLLLIVPAVGIDLVLQRWRNRAGWRTPALALALGAVFLIPFVAVQWPFAEVLNAAARRPTPLMQHLWPYMVPSTGVFATGRFVDPASGAALASGLAVALGLAALSSLLGLGWGSWMRRVRR